MSTYCPLARQYLLDYFRGLDCLCPCPKLQNLVVISIMEETHAIHYMYLIVTLFHVVLWMQLKEVRQASTKMTPMLTIHPEDGHCAAQGLDTRGCGPPHSSRYGDTVLSDFTCPAVCVNDSLIHILISARRSFLSVNFHYSPLQSYSDVQRYAWKHAD